MINRIVLTGRLTKDPELRYTPNGVAVTNFTLAVDRPFTNVEGERDTDFIRVVVWRKPAENAAEYLAKGNLAGVDGRLQTRSFENAEGNRVFVTEVVTDRVEFLEPKRHQQHQQNESPQKRDDDPFASGGPVDIKDEDLPF
ncbi:MAG TPA: single-stranded DNA-binding protein [Bacillales bacterium]|nr:single-stranded DNA-binding protein [Bacillales bacterium]